MFCVIHAEKIIMLLFILFVLLVNFPKFLKKKNGAPTAAMDLNFAIAILTTRPEARAELLTHGGITSALGRPVCSRLNSVCFYPFNHQQTLFRACGSTGLRRSCGGITGITNNM